MTWMDSEGNVLPDVPEKGADKDYKININKDSWIEKDGYFYFPYVFPLLSH